MRTGSRSVAMMGLLTAIGAMSISKHNHSVDVPELASLRSKRYRKHSKQSQDHMEISNKCSRGKRARQTRGRH
jgi:hypothetical protein